MRRYFARACAIASSMAVALVAAGCTEQDRAGFWSSPEARINAAFPVAESVRGGYANLLEGASKHRKKELAARYQARLQMRALDCAPGESPSRFESVHDIRRRLGPTDCFDKADAELSRWIALLRVGAVLAQPPLKPMPARAPAFVVAEGPISSAEFAAQAPVALVGVAGRRVQVIDMETSKSLFSEDIADARPGGVAPNGRLFHLYEGTRLRIRSTEGGAIVAELPRASYANFQWLDARTAVANRGDEGTGKAWLIDFETGTELPVTWATRRLQRATAVPGAPDHYVLFTDGAVTRVWFKRDGAQPTLSLVADKPAQGIRWAGAMSAAGPGRHLFLGTSRSLHWVDLRTLELRSASFEPFEVQGVVPAGDADPGVVLLRGNVAPSPGEAARSFLYAIDTERVMPLDPRQHAGSAFVHVPVFGKLAWIDDRRIELAPPIATQDGMPAAQFVAQAQELANDRKIAAFEKLQAERDGVPGTPSRLLGATLPAGVLASGTALASQVRQARVQAVGVYQGAAPSTAFQTQPQGQAGAVDIHVRRSARPIVLVLSSHEPVRWNLLLEPGSRLAAVVLSSARWAEVSGAPQVPVLRTRAASAYQVEGPEFVALNQEVMRLIGKGIAQFQGRYEGAQFAVGGDS